MGIVKMIRTLSVGFILSLILIIGPSSAFAITWGNDTDDQYPYVCMMGVSVDGEAKTICSGTLIGPTAVLTAGHCIEYVRLLEQFFGPDDVLVEVFFDPDLSQAGPGGGLKVVQYIAHPDYYWGPRSNPHDVGILILENPVEDIDSAILPDEGKLDKLRAEGKLGRGSNKAKFTTVGYGGTLEWPPPVINYYFVRQYAESEYRALLPAWLKLSQNQATGDGGSCFGDSGGPVFWTENGEEILVGITSWGDPNCISPSFNYRVDIQGTLEFIMSVLDSQSDN